MFDTRITSRIRIDYRCGDRNFWLPQWAEGFRET